VALSIEEIYMSDGGKGSAPRPFSVNQETFENNWDRIFSKNKQKQTSEFQDILSTEDCVLKSIEGVINDQKTS
jgi:hypothetical protein